MEKRRNDKGFSLVELIVVVAIMAVLMTVLAPQLLRYVEQSRVQKDESAIAELENAAEIAMSFEAINNAVAEAGGDATITLTGGASNDMSADDVVSVDALADELVLSIGTVDLTSNTYAGDTITVTVSIDPDTGVVTVSNDLGDAGDEGDEE